MTLDQIREPMLALLVNYGIDPEASPASVAFFDQKLSGFQEDERDQAVRYIEANLHNWFRSIDGNINPGWVQGFEWPFTEQGQPMVFIGTIELDEHAPMLPTSVFFVFWNPENDESTTIRQSIY